MVDTSVYKVGIVLGLEDCGGGGKAGGRQLRSCKVNVGDETDPITVVTSATNVRVGSRLAVAVVGTAVLNEEGDEIVVKRTSVGGVMSEGMFCDARMLGWQTNASGGIAQLIPDTVQVGDAPPRTKPRPPSTAGGTESDETSAAPVQGLFEKKLTKEEKKKLAEEKRKARKAAKEAKKSEADDE